MVRFTLRHFTPVTHWSLNGPQSRSGCYGEEKKVPSLPPPGIEARSSLNISVMKMYVKVMTLHDPT